MFELSMCQECFKQFFITLAMCNMLCNLFKVSQSNDTLRSDNLMLIKVSLGIGLLIYCEAQIMK